MTNELLLAATGVCFAVLIAGGLIWKGGVPSRWRIGIRFGRLVRADIAVENQPQQARDELSPISKE